MVRQGSRRLELQERRRREEEQEREESTRREEEREKETAAAMAAREKEKAKEKGKEKEGEIGKFGQQFARVFFPHLYGERLGLVGSNVSSIEIWKNWNPSEFSYEVRLKADGCSKSHCPCRISSDLHEWCYHCPTVSDMDPAKLNSR